MEHCFLYAFRQCWHCAMERDLLDEQDIELLESDDHDSGNEQLAEDENAVQHVGAVQQQRHRHLMLLRLAIVPLVVAIIAAGGGGGAAWAFCCRHFTLFVLLPLLLVSASVAALLFILLFLLPRLVCSLWVRHVDNRFRHFILALRQRELALFGLRHLSPSSHHLLSLRAQRVQCLRHLCHFVRTFNAASARLVLTSTERDSLLFNFVGDELRTLCRENDEPSADAMTADDNDLHINSLKSLWQYHFLVRSEFIRCALLALRHALRHRKCVAFCRHLALILNTVRTTATGGVGALPVVANVYSSSRSGRATTTTARTLLAPTAKSSVSGGADLAPMSDASMCCAQLEWALDRLQMPSSSSSECNVDSSPTWPPPVDVVKCVEQVAVSLRHALTKSQQSQLFAAEGIIIGGSFPSPNDDELGQAEQQQQQQQQMMPMAKNDDEDYQIFELDIGQTDIAASLVENHNGKRKRRSKIEEEEEDEFSASGNAAIAAAVTHDAMLRELGAALTLRKELCLRRERRALARARGLPDDAVGADELDRTPFAGSATVRTAENGAVTTAAATATTRNAAATTTTPPNQAFLMPSAEAVAAQRAAILGQGILLQQHNEMEQFGENEEGQQQ